MNQFEMHQTTYQHYGDLRAQARIEKMVDKQNVSAVAEAVIEGLSFSVCIAMIVLV